MKEHAAAILGITAVVVLLGAESVYATHPLGTEDPGTVAPKSVEAEVTIEHSSSADGTDGEFGVSVTTGLLEKVDVTVSAPYLMVNPDEGESENGIGDLELALKWHFLAGAGGWPDLAIKGAATIPTGDDKKGLGSGDYDISGTLMAGFSFKPVDIFLNLGYGRLNSANPDEGAKKDIVSGSVAAEWAVTEPIALVGDISYESKGADGEDSYVAATAGVVYDFSDGFSVDAGVRVGLTDPAPDWSVLAGVNLAF